jgi:hypothetical protein
LAHEEVLGRRRGGGGIKKEPVSTTLFINIQHPEALSPSPKGEEGGKDMDHGLENIVLKP